MTELLFFPDLGSRVINISYRYIPAKETRPRREFTVSIEDMDTMDIMLTDDCVLVGSRVTMKDCLFQVIRHGDHQDRKDEYPGEIRVTWDGTAKIIQGILYKLCPDDRPPRWKFRLSALETARVAKMLRRFQLICDIAAAKSLVLPEKKAEEAA